MDGWMSGRGQRSARQDHRSLSPKFEQSRGRARFKTEGFLVQKSHEDFRKKRVDGGSSEGRFGISHGLNMSRPAKRSLQDFRRIFDEKPGWFSPLFWRTPLCRNTCMLIEILNT